MQSIENQIPATKTPIETTTSSEPPAPAVDAVPVVIYSTGETTISVQQTPATEEKTAQDVAPETTTDTFEPVVDKETEVTQTVQFDPNGVSMKFSKEAFNFGTVKEGATPNGTIRLTNDGSTPLEILNISACYCLSVQESNNFIRPGDSIDLKIVFDSNDQVGPVSKDIDIIFKNTDKDGYPIVKRLKVKGKVVK